MLKKKIFTYYIKNKSWLENATDGATPLLSM